MRLSPIGCLAQDWGSTNDPKNKSIIAPVRIIYRAVDNHSDTDSLPQILTKGILLDT